MKRVLDVLKLIKIWNKSISVKEILKYAEDFDINKDGVIKISEILMYLIQKKW